jgi:hypothetical protein
MPHDILSTIMIVTSWRGIVFPHPNQGLKHIECRDALKSLVRVEMILPACSNAQIGLSQPKTCRISAVFLGDCRLVRRSLRFLFSTAVHGGGDQSDSTEVAE